MSWYDLTKLGVTLRPFDDPPPSGKTASPFDAPLRATLKVLERELRHLAAKQIVLQVGYREQDLRLDGMPRSSARMLHDAVALSFESRWGPLRYETNEFVRRSYRANGDGWEQNLRAIALAMEALRKVDRYGVSKRGEQYTGWRQLASGAHDDSYGIHSADQALDYLAERYGGSLTRALFESHPDRGGDTAEFHKVMRAKELLA